MLVVDLIDSIPVAFNPPLGTQGVMTIQPGRVEIQPLPLLPLSDAAASTLRGSGDVVADLAFQGNVAGRHTPLAVTGGGTKVELAVTVVGGDKFQTIEPARVIVAPLFLRTSPLAADAQGGYVPGPLRQWFTALQLGQPWSGSVTLTFVPRDGSPNATQTYSGAFPYRISVLTPLTRQPDGFAPLVWDVTFQADGMQ
jgi:hypothetical protein